MDVAAALPDGTAGWLAHMILFCCCLQATSCAGECPAGWREIKRASVCPDSSCNSVFLWINCGSCDGAYFGYPCDAFSQKALCERCS